MNAAPKTLRHLSELFAAGFAARRHRAALEKVAAQYAVAITPAMAELIDPADPHDPIARQFVPDAAELETQPQESADPIGDRCPQPGRRRGASLSRPRAAQAHRDLRGLLPLLLPPRNGGAGRGNPVAAAARYGAGLHRHAQGNLGGDPDRRRSAGAVAAPDQAGDDAARRDRAYQGRTHPHPHSCRPSRRASRRNWSVP